MTDSWQSQYSSATARTVPGATDRAGELSSELCGKSLSERERASALDELGQLTLMAGEPETAVKLLERASALNGEFAAKRDNPQPPGSRTVALSVAGPGGHENAIGQPHPHRIAIVSFLFNWPTTGGGNIHSVELARFLSEAGYEVTLICPRYSNWQIGYVNAATPHPVTSVPFDPADWNLNTILERLSSTVDAFAPDTVIITDAWNIKPHLWQAFRSYKVLLRMQAQECLCPLNNLRLLPLADGPAQCPDHQLASPDACRTCLVQNADTSGQLHTLERQLAGVDEPGYERLLRRSMREADAVLVLNPEIARVLDPYCGRVEIVTWGMDPERFPKPASDESRRENNDRIKSILFAGMRHEFIKGYQVLRDACRLLWEKRQDFKLVVTDTLRDKIDPFVWSIGWQRQTELPRWYRGTDITVVPTVVQDGLSRTSVEAMACGRPVVASRIGGLPFTVTDGETGMLFEPGNADELAVKLESLLDDASLRRRMGQAGRADFEGRFQWPQVIEQQYRPLLNALKRPAQKLPAAVQRSIASSNQTLEGDTRSKSLKILFLANFSGFWNSPAGVAEVLEELGHTVTRRHEFAVPNAETLIRDIQQGDYDCLLFSKGRLGAVTPREVLSPDGNAIERVLRRTDIPAYMWYGDRVLGFLKEREAWMKRVAPLCRIAFVNDGPLAETGWANFRLLRLGVLRHHIRSVSISESEKRDVAFIGSIYGSRESELAPVREIIGLDQITGVYGPQLSEVLNQYRIVLGPRFPSIPNYWSDRIYLVLGHGGFLLAPEVEGMRAEGLIPGVHYACVSHDTVRDVRFWLERPEERARIAAAGQRLVLDRFTCRHRLEEICGMIRQSLGWESERAPIEQRHPSRGKFDSTGLPGSTKSEPDRIQRSTDQIAI